MPPLNAWLWPPQILTLRTERSWKALAERINRTHQARQWGPWRMVVVWYAEHRWAAHPPPRPLPLPLPQDFAAHAHDVELAVLPRLAADMRAEELRAAGVLLQQQKQAASLAPQVQEP